MILNPVELENQILEANRICERGVEIFRESLEAFLAAETEYERAKAQGFMDHKGPQTEKRPASVLSAHEARKEMDRTRATFRYVEKKLDIAGARLMALQNLNKGVRTMYNMERGVGG